jgi:Ankyrin repeats (3 copies)
VLRAELLLKKKPKLAAVNKVNETPLHVAAQLGHAAIVAALVKSSPELVLNDAPGCTPVHAAAKHGKLAVLQELSKAGAALSGQVRAVHHATVQQAARAWWLLAARLRPTLLNQHSSACLSLFRRATCERTRMHRSGATTCTCTLNAGSHHIIA